MATVALNGAKNAGLLAARILAAFDADLQAKLDAYMADMAQQVRDAKL